jgi:hypothetical protein
VLYKIIAKTIANQLK